MFTLGWKILAVGWVLSQPDPGNREPGQGQTATQARDEGDTEPGFK